MIPYEACVYYTGDAQIKVNGESYFDFDDLYPELDNYDIVLEDEQVVCITGAMTKEQFNKLKESNKHEL